MPVDFSTSDRFVPAQSDGVMFAPTPIWDRDTKKRRNRRAAAGRPMRDPTPEAGESRSAYAAEPVDAAYEAQAGSPERATSRRRGVPAGAIVAGLAAVALVSAVGWYASQPRDDGATEVAPGATATSQTALNTATPPSATPMPVASTPAPQAAAAPLETAPAAAVRASTPVVTHQTRTTTTVARAPAARVRPAERNSALDAGVNAAASAPTIATPAPTPAMDSAPVSPPVSPMAPTAPTMSGPSVASPPPAAPASDPTTTP
jgi:cytoskeletal protein RodZ